MALQVPARFRRLFPCLLLAALSVWSLHPGKLPAADPPQTPPLPAAERERTKQEARQHLLQALKYLGTEYRAGFDFRFSALAEAEEKLNLERRHLGPVNTGVADSLALIAEAQLAREHYDDTRRARQDELAVKIRLYGPKHWQVIEARLDLADVEVYRNLSARQRTLLEDLGRLSREGSWYLAKGDYRAALASARKQTEVAGQALGQDHLLYIESLAELGSLYSTLGEYREAESLLRRSVEAERRLLGRDHPVYANGLQELAVLLLAAHGDHVRAEAYHKEALEVYKQALEPYRGALGKDPGVEDSILTSGGGLYCPLTAYAGGLVALGDFYLTMSEDVRAEPLLREAAGILRPAVDRLGPACLARLSDVGTLYRRREDRVQAGANRANVLLYAACLNGLARLYANQAHYTQAEEQAGQARRLRRLVVGEQHPTYALSLKTLARLYTTTGDYGGAEQLFAEAARIDAHAFGEAHISHADSLHNRAQLHAVRGDYAAALRQEKESLELLDRLVGGRHPDYARGLRFLGALCLERGDYVQAENALRQAEEIYRNVLGEGNCYYADALASRGWLAVVMGDYGRAEAVLRQARGIYKKQQGQEYERSDLLNSLAALYLVQGRLARARPLLERVVVLRKQTLHGEHPAYAASLQDLGLLTYQLGDYSEAVAQFRKALEVVGKVLGEEHPFYALVLDNLGRAYQAAGEPARAEELLRRAAAIRRQQLGEHHLAYAATLGHLGLLYDQLGRPAQAQPLLREALAITRQKLQQTFTIQSERQQLLLLRAARLSLDDYLAVALARRLPAEPVYAEILWWKGAIFARQRRQRLARAAADPEMARLFAALEQASSRLASLLLAAPEATRGPVWRRELETAKAHYEQLEAELARRSAAYQDQQAQEGRTLEAVRAALPPGTALVDFLEYVYRHPPEGSAPIRVERRLAAFVVRPESSLVALDLGPSRPVAAAVGRWRRAFSRPGAPPPGVDPGAELRQLLWQPLEKHLAGARAVLLSPDGVLAGLPFAALPGARPGTYLIEDLPLAVVPVPQLLPELLAPEPAQPRRPGPSLLVLGDVDFGAPPPQANPVPAGLLALRGSSLFQFQPLPGTAQEMEAVRAAFRRGYPQAAVSELRGAQALEAAFRARAPGQRYLHLATHGFFAPPELRSALLHTVWQEDLEVVTGLHPGLLSGVVLAGANRGWQPSGDAEPVDDGILTALEVTELDLRGAELVVLSACETGLGSQAGGEGLLGLQRAFQLAGARTVVASLWKVDDAATRVLMEEFYRNLWERKCGKLEALRQAQWAVLRDFDPQAGQLRGAGRRVPVKARDLAKARQQLGVPPGRLPPFYWAGFVLSGDWR